MGDHHHHGPVAIKHLSNAFLIGIFLNICFVIIEVIFGLYNHSLSLLTDAGHNLSDVGSLAISLLAFSLAKIKPTARYTYGYKKTTILASLFNGIILLVAVGAIFVEAIHRFSSPITVQGKQIAIVALIGIFINSFSAWLFHKDKDSDLNAKGAYLHLMADALVSLGVVIGGVLIYYTELYWIDPVLSIIIAVVIFFSSIGLLKDSVLLAIDAVPENVDIEKVKQLLSQYDSIIDCHHIHVWAISTTQNALTAHLVASDNIAAKDMAQLTDKIKQDLLALNIHHATLEMNTEKCYCGGIACE